MPAIHIQLSPFAISKFPLMRALRQSLPALHPLGLFYRTTVDVLLPTRSFLPERKKGRGSHESKSEFELHLDTLRPRSLRVHESRRIFILFFPTSLSSDANFCCFETMKLIRCTSILFRPSNASQKLYV